AVHAAGVVVTPVGRRLAVAALRARVGDRRVRRSRTRHGQGIAHVVVSHAPPGWILLVAGGRRRQPARVGAARDPRLPPWGILPDRRPTVNRPPAVGPAWGGGRVIARLRSPGVTPPAAAVRRSRSERRAACVWILRRPLASPAQPHRQPGADHEILAGA